MIDQAQAVLGNHADHLDLFVGELENFAGLDDDMVVMLVRGFFIARAVVTEIVFLENSGFSRRTGR